MSIKSGNDNKSKRVLLMQEPDDDDEIHIGELKKLCPSDDKIKEGKFSEDICGEIFRNGAISKISSHIT